MTILFKALDNTIDDSSRPSGSLKYEALLYLSVLASVATTWEVKTYIRLSNTPGVQTTMECQLERFVSQTGAGHRQQQQHTSSSSAAWG